MQLAHLAPPDDFYSFHVKQDFLLLPPAGIQSTLRSSYRRGVSPETILQDHTWLPFFLCLA